MDTLRVRDAKDVEEVVRAAIANEQPLEIIGHGSKRSIGHTMATNAVLDLSALNAVTSYEPNELIITVQSGAPLADVQSLIDSKNQQFAFEPMDTSSLLGVSGSGTIGGMIGAGLAGPRRIKAGGARDHLLGAHAVSGFGDSFKTGGRVVKNVTGYDLCKLLAGSWGTLAVMTDVTVKVLPRAETEQTLLVLGLDDAAAARAMSLAMGSANDVSGAAHLSAPLAANVRAEAGTALTALRLEGVGPSVAHRRHALEAALKSFGEITVLEEAASRMLWRSVRDVVPFAHGDRALWRISTAPTRGHVVAAAIGPGAFLYDWAGGLIWAALPAADDGGAARVGAAVGANGHATLIRAPAAVRAAVAVFQPQDAGLAALTRRVKESFDPNGVLGPGRMYAGA